MPKLTDRFLASFRLDPDRKDQLVFDTECPGLGVRITMAGSRTFLVQWTDPATKRKIRERLGVWGGITIDQARSAARAQLGSVAKGGNPAEDRKRAKAAADAERAENALSFDLLLDRWAAIHLKSKRPRYAAEAVRALRFAFTDQLNKPAAHLARADVISTLDRLVTDGKDTMAGRTIAYGRACYAWAAKRELVANNPFANLPITGRAAERDRTLTDAEVAEIWAATGALSEPFRQFYRVALLTLQRREEVAGMRWSELSADLATWTIPGPRMKNGKAHDVHLAAASRDVIKSIARVGKSDLVFSTNGTTPVSGFSKTKASLDETIVATRTKMVGPGNKPKPIIPWRLHDFRRTGVTRLAALGFDSIVVDKLLAHKATKLSGVAAVYQRHEFLDERARALDAWAAHIERFTAPKSSVFE